MSLPSSSSTSTIPTLDSCIPTTTSPPTKHTYLSFYFVPHAISLRPYTSNYLRRRAWHASPKPPNRFVQRTADHHSSLHPIRLSVLLWPWKRHAGLAIPFISSSDLIRSTITLPRPRYLRAFVWHWGDKDKSNNAGSQVVLIQSPADA